MDIDKRGDKIVIGRRGFIAGLAGLIGSTVGTKMIEEKPGVYRIVRDGSRMVCLKCGWAPLDDDQYRQDSQGVTK